jgi:very-long-chain (3R)-3-hydroxyacyl-CoA dehydratase
MVLAWSSTEVIRYLFYAFSLSGIESSALQWLRYTTFFVLYPVGAASEAFLMYASLPTDPLRGESVEGYSPYDFLRLVFFAIWWPGAYTPFVRQGDEADTLTGLYVMYTYMIKQRRKVLGGQRTSKVKTQ